jgi:hypothetical protein
MNTYCHEIVQISKVTCASYVYEQQQQQQLNFFYFQCAGATVVRSIKDSTENNVPKYIPSQTTDQQQQ